jgi:hypothetical protein
MTPRERLAFLADALSKPLPEDITFNLGPWHIASSCGTICCAVGYAGTLPEMQADGLEMVNGTILFGGYRHWDAVQAFFGLTEVEACKLFLASEYPHGENTRPGEVSNRIYARLLKIQRSETAPS